MFCTNLHLHCFIRCEHSCGLINLGPSSRSIAWLLSPQTLDEPLAHLFHYTDRDQLLAVTNKCFLL